MSAWPTPLVCSGRPVDDRLQPVGDPCGARFKASAAGETWLVPGVYVDRDGTFSGARFPTAVEQDAQARAGGWSVHVLDDGSRAATCPQCRRPNPAVVADCRAIQQELLTEQPENGAPIQ